MATIHTKHPVARLSWSDELEGNHSNQPVVNCMNDSSHNKSKQETEKLKNSENEVKEYVKIDLDDVQIEIDLWKSSIICYVVGSNPPLNVFEGYIRRLWKKFNLGLIRLL